MSFSKTFCILLARVGNPQNITKTHEYLVIFCGFWKIWQPTNFFRAFSIFVGFFVEFGGFLWATKYFRGFLWVLFTKNEEKKNFPTTYNLYAIMEVGSGRTLKSPYKIDKIIVWVDIYQPTSIKLPLKFCQKVHLFCSIAQMASRPSEEEAEIVPKSEVISCCRTASLGFFNFWKSENWEICCSVISDAFYLPSTHFFLFLEW